MSTKLSLPEAANWIGEIKKQIQNLFYYHYIFWEVQKIVKSNQQLSATHSHFFDWLVESFAVTSAMYVRRQVDRRRDVISFRRLLDGLCNSPHLITRADFIERWVGSEPEPFRREEVARAEDLFNQSVGVACSHLERKQIRADIELLEEKARAIESFANHYYAHTGAQAFNSEHPTFIHLRECMSCLETLLQKYYLLINATILADFDIGSMFIYDWKKIFTFPWINSTDTAQR
ncbi:MAG: hypothetical protein LC800_17490 [Acidobacteria bacterium]|nr:hypothetical protein [Acidobacteriota bacterium]